MNGADAFILFVCWLLVGVVCLSGGLLVFA